MLNVFTDRPAEDILGRVVHVTLGGQVYDLPVLTIAGNKRWKAQLDQQMTSLLNGLEGVQDTEATGKLLALLGQQVDDMLDLLYAYDTSGLLPARDVLEETTYESELLTAVREVWQAANPFVVGGIVAMAAALETSAPASSEPTSTPPPPTAGRRRASKVS